LIEYERTKHQPIIMAGGDNSDTTRIIQSISLP